MRLALVTANKDEDKSKERNHRQASKGTIPPYNTGHDFIYDDDFAETHAEYAASSGEFDEEGLFLLMTTSFVT